MDYKQKAKELVNMYINRNYKGDIPNEIYNRQIINQTLITVEEMITELSRVNYRVDVIDLLDYWQKVKLEVQKWYL